MHRTTISTLLIAALLMLPGGKLVAYPISPVTLWELVSQSDQIIVARVTALCDLEVTIDGDTIRLKNEIAILEVLETWKGKPLKRIEVVIGSDEICPAPAVYVKDKTVLTFLQKRYNQWNTCGLSYGSLYPGREDLEVFRDRVKVALRLQQQKDHSEKDKIAWLVDTASRRATRLHGLYELVPSSDRAHSYYDGRPGESRAVNLSEAQLRTLAKGFVEEPGEGVTLPMMLSILKDYPDPTVDATSVALIDKLMQGERLPSWMDQLLSLVCERVGRPMPANASGKPGEPWLQDPLFADRDLSDAELKAIWANLRKAIKVPRIQIPKTPETLVPGVGEGTPP